MQTGRPDSALRSRRGRPVWGSRRAAQGSNSPQMSSQQPPDQPSLQEVMQRWGNARPVFWKALFLPLHYPSSDHMTASRYRRLVLPGTINLERRRLMLLR